MLSAQRRSKSHDNSSSNARISVPTSTIPIVFASGDEPIKYGDEVIA